MTTTEQPTVNPNRPACIANSDTSVGPEVTLWDCPCINCWRLAQDITDESDRELYREWRDERLLGAGPRTPVVAPPAPTTRVTADDPHLFEVIYDGSVIGTTRRLDVGLWEATPADSTQPSEHRHLYHSEAVRYVHEQHLAKVAKQATETAHEATIVHPVTGQYHDVIVTINDETNDIVSITPKDYGR